MRFDDQHESPDVIDRRGQTARGGGGGGVPWLLLNLVGSRFGIGGVVVVLAGYYGLQMLGGGLNLGGSSSATAPTRGNDQEKAFVSFVLDDVQSTWTGLMPGYRKAKLVLFTGRTNTACGMGESATGPFYCPADQRAYIDLSFFQQLSRQLGAPGDFAQAYVLAHEIGHHVQNLQGTSTKVHRASKSAQKGANGLSVRLELQADCFAGVWAASTRQKGLLEEGDIEEALTAAGAIGDDTLQRNSSGTVRPETFSHGTSAQRARWFRRGLEAGRPDACDTFSGAI